MSASVRDAVIRLWRAGKSTHSISRTVSLPVYDIEQVIRDLNN